MEYRQQIQFIRSQYLQGKLTYEQMIAAGKPILDKINKRGAEVAKEHGQKFRPLTLSYILR